MNRNREILASLSSLHRKMNSALIALEVVVTEDEIEMAWIDDMRAELANNTTVAQGAVVAVNTLADKVQELINNGADPAELQSFVDTLRANDVAVSDAIKARTASASEPAPAPVEPAVEPVS